MTLLNCFPKGLYQFTYSPVVYDTSSCSTSSPTLGIVHLLNFSQSDVVQILISLMAKKVGPLFMLIDHVDILLCEIAALSFLPC